MRCEKARTSGPSHPVWLRCGRSATYRLQVVRRPVIGNVLSERLSHDVCAAVVEASPDAGIDELGEWLREGVERAHSGPSRIHEGARDLEATMKYRVAEEHPQHGDVCAVEAVVSRGPLGIRRGKERRPGRVGIRSAVPILQSSWNRVPRPPEVEVVLIVPAVDRRVRRAQDLQGLEPEQFMFSSRVAASPHLSTRQCSPSRATSDTSGSTLTTRSRSGSRPTPNLAELVATVSLDGR